MTSAAWRQLTRRCKVWRCQTVDALIHQQNCLVSDPLSDWQPVKALQNWLHSPVLLGTCNDTSRTTLNHLQFVQQLAANTDQDAVAVVETTSNRRVYQRLRGLDRQWLLNWPQPAVEVQRSRIGRVQQHGWPRCQAERQDRCPSVHPVPDPTSRVEAWGRRSKLNWQEAHDTGEPWPHLEVKGQRSRSLGRLMLRRKMRRIFWTDKLRTR